jgi:hypothetical protein
VTERRFLMMKDLAQEKPGPFGARAVEERLGGVFLNDLAPVDEDDAVRNRPCRVVRD